MFSDKCDDAQNVIGASVSLIKMVIGRDDINKDNSAIEILGDNVVSDSPRKEFVRSDVIMETGF